MQVIEQAGKTIILNSGFKLSFEPLTQLTEEWRTVATLGEEHDERLRIVLPIDQNMRGVNMIDPLSVEPLSVYWARRKTQDAESDECEVVQISTVFGHARDYWSVAVLGSDQHYSLHDFEFVAPICAPDVDAEN